MSQRDLASAIGVSPATIARAERDGATVTLPVLLAALAQGGIDLVAIDGTGEEVFIMRPDALRDRGNRQLPAHLDAWIPSLWEGDARPPGPGDRPVPAVRYARRQYRDVRRQRQLDPLLYHPGPEDIEIARRRDADQPRTPALTSQLEPTECFCPTSCLESLEPCSPDCPCQCETEPFPSPE